MKKRMFLKRLTIFLCVLSVLSSMFFYTSSIKASQYVHLNAFLSACGLPQFENYNSSYQYILYVSYNDKIYLIECVSEDSYLFFSKYGASALEVMCYHTTNYNQYLFDSSSESWVIKHSGPADTGNPNWIFDHTKSFEDYQCYFIESSLLVYSANPADPSAGASVVDDVNRYKVYDYGIVESVPLPDIGGGSVSAELGYIKNINHEVIYEMGALANYIEDSRTDFWSFDQYTTTEVDLTVVNYSVRHYIQPVLVKNYTAEGVVEEYEKYFMGEYDASNLEFSYLRKDYDKKMKDAGYEGLSFWDSFLGRFILEWHYFELVDNDTGSIGGYVIVKPKSDGSLLEIPIFNSEFGVDFETEGFLPDGSVDEEYVSEEVGYGMGGGLTIEEARENAKDDSQRVNPIAGIDGFSSSLVSFTSSVENVPLAIKSIIDMCPSWMLALFGLSFAMTFLAILIKVLRG